jgi:tetratricopeptide (TPR) repeat protein
MKFVFTCVFLGIACLTAAAQDLDRGIELYRKNDFGEAASVLRRVVDQDKDNARANLYLGLALIEQGKVSESEPFIARADELAPSAETKTGKARLLIEKKEYDAAEAALKDADSDDAPYVRGLLELNRKQYAEAARDLDEYSKSHPDHAYAHYYAGLAYNGLKRPDKMLTHFEQFLKMKPDAPEARKVNSVMRAVR